LGRMNVLKNTVRTTSLEPKAKISAHSRQGEGTYDRGLRG
jgi:hypothetical protein